MRRCFNPMAFLQTILYMNNTTKVRIVYECSIIGIVLLTFLKSMFPYMDAWWYVALIASLTGTMVLSLSYLKRHNYRWGFSYIENHLYIDLLLKVQKWFQNATNHGPADTYILDKTSCIIIFVL